MKIDILDRLEKVLSNSVDESKEADVKSKIWEYLTKNPAPPDSDIHELADKMGIDSHTFEAYIYEILGSFVGFGMANKKGFTEKDADPEQLKMGIEVEHEHTNNPVMAKRIALDHLAEIKDYYTRLAKMEKDADVED